MKTRIVKIPNEPLYEELSIDKPCPFCGEVRPNSICLPTQGVSRTKKTWFTGIFKIKKHSVERYICLTCHSIWEENKQTEPFDLENYTKEENNENN